MKPQTIFKVDPSNRNYTKMDNTTIKDPNLSGCAKGVLAYLLHLPDDWKIFPEEIATHFTDSKYQIKKSLKELEAAGYINHTPIYENRRITEYRYTIFATKQTLPTQSQQPETASADTNTATTPSHTTYKRNNKRKIITSEPHGSTRDKQHKTQKSKISKPIVDSPTKKSNKRNIKNIKDNEKTKTLIDSIPPTFEECMGQKLYSYVRKEQRIIYTKVDYWVKEIRYLLRRGIPKERIRILIDWLTEEPDDQFIPKLYKAADFRQKFIRLEDAMKRQAIKADPVTNLFIEPLVEDILVKLADLDWPQDCQTTLPAIVQKSYTNYKTYIEKHKKLKTQPEISDEIKRFAIYLEENISLGPKDFLIDWFKQACNQVRSWQNWSGNLDHFIFTYQNKNFTIIGSKVAVKFCANPKRWTRYITTLDGLK